MNLLIRLLAVALAFGGLHAARAQTVIDHLPYTINAPGLYVLNSNLSSTQTDGNLIVIGASNVTLDFQGHYISGSPSSRSLSTVGIRAYEQSNLTIKNGTIAYCGTGMYISGNGGPSANGVGELIDNMRVTYCYVFGISVHQCLASRIQNCQVSQTGYSGASSAFAIDGYESGVSIQNNIVGTVLATDGYGIYAVGGFARGNTISNCTYGVRGGKYQDNLTYGCATPVSNGIDAGGNN